MHTYDDLIQAIVEERRRQGISIPALSRRTGIPEPSLSRYLGSRRQPIPSDRLLDLCDVLGLRIRATVTRRYSTNGVAA